MHKKYTFPEKGSFLLAIASLIWLVLRTGMKPSRAAYPCQKAALANVAAVVGTLVLPALSRRHHVPLFLAAVILFAGIVAADTGVFSRAAPVGTGQVLHLTLTGIQQPTDSYSDIFAVQGTTGADGGFQKLIDLMEEKGVSFYSLIGPTDVVIIKVNCQWDERGGTNTDLVKAMIECIVKHPGGFAGEVVIADNGQAQAGSGGAGGSLDWKSSNAEDRTQSMQKVADSFAARYKVSTALWDRITTTRVGEYSDGDTRSGYVVDSSPSTQTGIIVTYPKFETRSNTRISFKKGIWDPARRSYDSGRLKVVNVPVLKSHIQYGVTASVKHYLGVASERLTHTAHTSVGSGGMGTQMAETRVPVLNVIDAIWVNAAPGRGPLTTYADASRVNIVAAGRDPAALDYWAAKNILMPAAKKLGYKNVDGLNPDAAGPGLFGNWLRLSMKELQRAGIPSTIDIDRINVTVSSMEQTRQE